jgi:hypothetical protein
MVTRYIFTIGKLELYKRMRDWTITFKPSTLSHTDPFFVGKSGVGGHTGVATKSITVYVRDVKDDLSFYPNILINMIAVTHEVAHAILSNLKHHVPLKNDDFSGNKAGTLLPFFVAAVHDLHTSGKVFSVPLPVFDWRSLKTRLVVFKGIDIREIYNIYNIKI